MTLEPTALETEESMSHHLPGYAKLARRRFCAGTRGKTPAELVLSGVRSLEEWVEVLQQERERTQHHNLKSVPTAIGDRL